MELVQAKVLDSTHLELAKPIAAAQGGSVYVVVGESANTDAEKEQWVKSSAQSLGSAYGDAEPEYPSSMIRETNPDYKA